MASSLTNRELTMQMGAFEALEHGIPILASPTAVLRDYLDQGGVVFVKDHTPAELAAGIRALWRERERLRTEALAARRTMFERAGQDSPSCGRHSTAIPRIPTSPQSDDHRRHRLSP